MKLPVLVNYLADYLSVDLYKDYAPNGLQVQGRDEIRVICTAVTASLDVIERAKSYNADALLVHHGYFWKGESAQLTGVKYNRLKQLMSAEINLLAYHLPLDCHPTIGNNILLSKCVDLMKIQSHNLAGNPNLLWSGELNTPISGTILAQQLSKYFKRTVQHISGSNGLIKKIAWCSGGAQDYIENAALLGVDAYLSGEVSERTYYLAHELGIDYFGCGHHATERAGVQALGEHLALQYQIDHHFIDSNNPF